MYREYYAKLVESCDFFDMIEYFCNGHDDTAVDIVFYDCNGNMLGTKPFSWSTGCGEVTSEGIWREADKFAAYLLQNGKKLRNKSRLF